MQSEFVCFFAGQFQVASNILSKKCPSCEFLLLLLNFWNTSTTTTSTSRTLSPHHSVESQNTYCSTNASVCLFVCLFVCLCVCLCVCVFEALKTFKFTGYPGTRNGYPGTKGTRVPL